MATKSTDNEKEIKEKSSGNGNNDHQDSGKPNKSDDRPDRLIELQVQTPRGLWNKKQPPKAELRPVYDKTTKIQQIIDDARKVFKFVENDNKYTLFLGEQQLEPNRTVVSYHLEDGTLLVLSVQGGNA